MPRRSRTGPPSPLPGPVLAIYVAHSSLPSAGAGAAVYEGAGRHDLKPCRPNALGRPAASDDRSNDAGTRSPEPTVATFARR
jgi:hypothetical protein